MKIINILILICITFASIEVFAAKATIAIGTIEYRAIDSISGSGPEGDTRAFVDMLTTALVKAQKFNVIERDRTAEIFEEQGLSMQGIVKGGAQGGFNLKGVDYVLTGAITEYGESSQAAGGNRFSAASKTAVMAVDIRVLDVADGSIGLADTVRIEVSGGGAMSVKGFSGGSAKNSGQLLGEVMRETASSSANIIVTSIYPIKIISITKQGKVMLNYGDGYLEKDEEIKIFRQGESFIDPDTKEVLGSDEEFIGSVVVFDTLAKFSKANIVKGKDNIAVGMIGRKVVAEKGKRKKGLKLF